MGSSRYRWVLATMMVLALLVAACGGGEDAVAEPDEAAADSDEAESDDGGEAGDEAAEAADEEPAAWIRLQEIYEELDGLEGEERFEALLALADEEEGKLSLYTSTNLAEAGPLLDAFDDRFDKDVSLYNALRTDILQRLQQEADAGFVGADVVMNNTPETAITDRDLGLLLPLRTPLEDALPESLQTVSENWAATDLNVWTPAWNTNLLAGDQLPTTWEEALVGFDGRVAGMEPRNWPWFAELVQYFQEEGMTEDEAVGLFETAIANSSAIRGHTTLTQLLAGGEFDFAHALYVHGVQREERVGAPISWEPAVEPLIANAQTVGIHRDTRMPATALLFVEFMLSPETQNDIGEIGRTPVDPNATGGLGDVEVRLVDMDILTTDRDMWEQRWEDLIRAGGLSTD